MLEPWTPGAAAKPTGPSWPKTVHDALPWRNGVKLGDVTSDQLIRDAINLGVVGVSWGMGRLQVANAIAAHMGSIHERAGNEAVQKWLNGGA